MKVLAEAFVVPEEKGFVFLRRSAEGCSELVALKGRGGALIEIVGGVERVVAQKFVDRSVEMFGRSGDDNDLAAGTLAEFGAVIVAQDVEFLDGIDTQQLLAGSAGSHVVFGGAGEFDAVKQEEILLRAVAVDGEVVGGGGVGDADAAGFLRREIDDAGIEGEQEIVAAAVEGKILNLLARRRGRRCRWWRC